MCTWQERLYRVLEALKVGPRNLRPVNFEGFGYSAVEVILYCTDTMIEASSDFTLPLPGVFPSIDFSNLPFRVVG